MTMTYTIEVFLKVQKKKLACKQEHEQRGDCWKTIFEKNAQKGTMIGSNQGNSNVIHLTGRKERTTSQIINHVSQDLERSTSNR